jgi:hypothetical protein
MPTFAEKAGVRTVFREETTFGTLADNDSDAQVFRANSGAGLQLTKETIAVREVRGDQQKVRDRHGFRSVGGDMTADLSLITFDALLEAGFRGTWESPLTSGTFALSYNPSTGVLTRDSGNFGTEGFRVGDVVIPAGLASGNGARLIVSAVGSTTMTIANKSALGTLTADAGASLTRGKKLEMPASPVKRSFSWEHWVASTSTSQRFTGCRINSLGFDIQPGSPVGLTVGVVGQNMDTDTAQYFTSATEDDSPPLVAVDATICYNGAPIATLTQASVAWNLGMAGQPVVGSVFTPDVFGGVVQPSVSLSTIISDDSIVDQFLNETTGLSLQFMFNEVGTSEYLCLNVPSFTVGNAQTERIDSAGAQIVQATLLVGIPTETNRDASMFTLTTSAA